MHLDFPWPLWSLISYVDNIVMSWGFFADDFLSCCPVLLRALSSGKIKLI